MGEHKPLLQKNTFIYEFNNTLDIFFCLLMCIGMHVIIDSAQYICQIPLRIFSQAQIYLHLLRLEYFIRCRFRPVRAGGKLKFALHWIAYTYAALSKLVTVRVAQNSMQRKFELAFTFGNTMCSCQYFPFWTIWRKYLINCDALTYKYSSYLCVYSWDILALFIQKLNMSFTNYCSTTTRFPI